MQSDGDFLQKSRAIAWGISEPSKVGGWPVVVFETAERASAFKSVLEAAIAAPDIQDAAARQRDVALREWKPEAVVAHTHQTFSLWATLMVCYCAVADVLVTNTGSFLFRHLLWFLIHRILSAMW